MPLGYDADPVSRKLVVNPAEAQQVRNIFSIFLEQQSLQGALEHIGSRGDRTKSGVTRKGRRYEGTPFDRPALVRLLTNVLYVGDVWHGGIVYPGEQEAIVDRQVWTRANELLQAQKREPNGRIRERRGALLQGRLECGVCGKPMLHGYTTKHGRRYRYYLCLTARRKGAKACPDQMIAARRIEHGVLAALQELGCEGETAQPSHEMIERARYDHRCGLVLLHLREGSELGKARHIEVDVRKPVLVSKCEPAGETEEPPVARITGMMALAIRFESLLEQGAAKNHRQLARLAKVSPARIAQLLKLTHLAPAIQEQLLFLNGPAPKFQEPALRRIADELSWTKQLKLFEELCA